MPSSEGSALSLMSSALTGGFFTTSACSIDWLTRTHFRRLRRVWGRSVRGDAVRVEGRCVRGDAARGAESFRPASATAGSARAVQPLFPNLHQPPGSLPACPEVHHWRGILKGVVLHPPI